MKKLVLSAVALTLSSTLALAESPYCTSTREGRVRIPKTGNHCPTGYIASGPCCVALHADTPRAFPKIEGASCPAGTFRSGSACKSFR
jgi:hypothetical protein